MEAVRYPSSLMGLSKLKLMVAWSRALVSNLKCFSFGIPWKGY